MSHEELEPLRRPIEIINAASQRNSFAHADDAHQFEVAVDALIHAAPISLILKVHGRKKNTITDQEWEQILAEDPILAHAKAILDAS